LDSDGSSQLIGFHECTLVDLVRHSADDKYSQALEGPHDNAGSIVIKAEEKRNASMKVNLDLEVTGLPECTKISKCNFSTTYFMEIYRGPRGNNGKIYESDYFVDEMDFQFPTIEFDDAQLCQREHDSQIEIKFINRNQYQMVNTEVCHCITSLNELKSSMNGGKLQLKNAEGNNVAKLIVSKCETENIPSFTDYLKADYKISLIGAIDFTYSNGMPSNPTSLHYTGGHNQYIEAIRAVGDILNSYDSDK
jgi:hypothetical protein